MKVTYNLVLTSNVDMWELSSYIRGYRVDFNRKETDEGEFILSFKEETPIIKKLVKEYLVSFLKDKRIPFRLERNGKTMEESWKKTQNKPSEKKSTKR